jgi:hypothetical protein
MDEGHEVRLVRRSKRGFSEEPPNLLGTYRVSEATKYIKDVQNLQMCVHRLQVPHPVTHSYSPRDCLKACEL